MPVNTPDALRPPLDAGVRYLLAAAPREGKSVGVASGLRTRDEQIALRQQHCGPTDYDIFEKPSGQCSPPTARPGTSRHETGEAVDLNGDLSWAFGKLSRHGFTRPVGGEPWHFEHPATRATGADGELTRARVALALVDQYAKEAGIDPDVAYPIIIGRDRGDGSIGPVPGSVVGALGPAVGIAYDVGSAIASPLDGLAAIGRLGSILLTLEFWRRLGLGIAGAALLIFGAVIINRDTLTGVMTP